MAKTEHIHKFKRLIYKSGNSIFFCATPDCKQKISIPLALGKRSICWRCGEPFVMNEYSLRLAKPHCDACHKPKKIDEKLDDIMIAVSPEAIDELLSDPKELNNILSLSERLEQTIQQVQKESEEEL
jgi:hypothetical protein